MIEIINGRYILQNKIGSGGMGIVYRTTDRLTQETVALKQVTLSGNLKIGDSLVPGATEDDLRLALAHEFQILAGLRHPHIISVLDYGFDEARQPFFTMTYLPESQNILEAAQDMPFERKIELIQQLLQALSYLHRRGVLHRDLKPDNVLVSDGGVRVLDFGLSISDKISGSDSVGTPLYMAPELFEGLEYSRMADLYAVGVLLYQLLTSEHPFAPFDYAFLDRLLDETPDLEQIDARIRPFLAQLLAKTAEQRFTTAMDALLALAEALEQPLPAETTVIRESYLQAATFVGRETEMTQLRDALIHTENDSGVIYLVGGESGVGKSRLLDEFRTHALVAGWQVIIGQDIAEDGVLYHLWREVVMRLALNTELSDLEASVLQETVPSLGTLLNRYIRPVLSLSGSAGELRFASTLISILQRQARPTLLILEDLQWSNSSLGPLKQMLKVLEQLPSIMIVGSYRHDERPHLPDELPRAKRLLLERLNDTEIEKLSKAMLGDIGTHANILSLLTRETEGNTFFIVEVMRALAEDAGQLFEIEEATLPTAVFTSGMETLLQWRINKVAVEDRALLYLAAVSGRQLDLQLLELLMPDADIKSWLQRISDAGICSLLEGQWLFCHDKLRQATLAQLTTSQCKKAHRRVAFAIEHLYPGNDRYYPSLMAHWQIVEDDEKELTYLLPVAKRMIEFLSDYNRGLELICRGLVLLSPTDLQRVKLLNLQAEVYTIQAKLDEGERVAKQAFTLAEANCDKVSQVTSLNWLGHIYCEQSRYNEAHGYLQQALTIGEEVDDTESRATTLVRLGVIADFQKNYPVAENYFQQSLSLRKSIGDQMGMTQCFFFLGMLASQYYNDFEKNLNYAEKNLTIYEEIGNQYHISKTYTSMGIDYASIGRYATAHDYFHKSLAIKKTLGDSAGIAHTYLVLGEAHFFKGIDYEQVLHYQEQSLQLFLELNVLAMVGISYGYIALSHVALGNYKRATETALGHFELQATLELDKSNGLVHVAVAEILSAFETNQVEDADYQELVEKITVLTQLEETPMAYIEEALRVSTIAQIRLIVLMECGQLALQLGQEEAAHIYLSEAKTMAEKAQNQYKLDQIEAISASRSQP